MAKGFTKLEALVVLVIIAILIAILLPAIRDARLAAEWTERRNALKWIGLGFANFNDAYRRLPAAVRRDDEGRPLCSWRFQLVPFLSAWMLGVHFGERWDDPDHRLFTSEPLFVYCHQPDEGFHRSLHTNVVVITGPGTAFDEHNPVNLRDLDDDMILAIEVAESNTHWAEPGGDLLIGELSDSILSGLEGRGLHVLYADGSVGFVSRSVPLSDFKKFLTIEGAKQYDRDEVF